VNNKSHYDSLTYESMRQLALDDSVGDSERVGFPSAYREGREECIVEDIAGKLTNMEREGQTFIEVGSGYSQLTQQIISRLSRKNTRMIFSDSEEMLSLIPRHPLIDLVPGPFPANWNEMSRWEGSADMVLCYSVTQMVCKAGNVLEFADRLAMLLRSGGQLLIGDLPNDSKRARFFSSEEGRRFHREFAARHHLQGEMPRSFLHPEPGSLDDAFVISFLTRFRSQGYEAYVMPQHPNLPFANRREDILIVKH
jgi:hypothetical protein